MATTRISINKRHTSKDGCVVPYILYCHKYDQMRVSTEVRVPVMDFDLKRCEVKKTNKHSVKLNALIKKKRDEIENIALQARLEGVDPSVQYVKSVLKCKIRKSVPLLEFIHLYASEQVGIKKHRTIQSYNVSINHIEQYCEYLGRPINYDDIDKVFYDNFVRFLQQFYNLAANSVANHIKNLKVFLGVAFERGYHKNVFFKHKQFKVPSEISDSIALNEEELKRIADLDLSNDECLDRVRSLFLISCWTGLRWSDFTRLREEYIKDGFIHVNTAKTDAKVILPIHPSLNKIFDKYIQTTGKPFPEPISNQKYNDALKEVGRLAGISEATVVRRSNGGVIQETIYKKYEKLSSHCGRRSFATNMIKKNVPAHVVMKLTGHKNLKSFQLYVKVGAIHAAEIIQDVFAKEI